MVYSEITYVAVPKSVIFWRFNEVLVLISYYLIVYSFIIRIYLKFMYFLVLKIYFNMNKMSGIVSFRKNILGWLGGSNHSPVALGARNIPM